MNVETPRVKGCERQNHSPLLERFWPQLHHAATGIGLPILDLACGTGRNGLFVNQHSLEHGKHSLPIVFSDRNEQSLQTIQSLIEPPSTLWTIDFEAPDSHPLAGKSYSAIMVFRYLHRPLFASIKQAIAPGGLIIYETFTVKQAELGRPKNPDFLLKSGELSDIFAGWQVLHQFEGMVNGSAIAQIVAIKP
ncbi:MAG: tellurite methyltransferase [Phenylobacterium sp.]|jgi:tellurite methyltransferase